MEVTKANLATYLAGLAPSATPYTIEITETVASDWRSSATTGTVGNIIKNNTPSGVYLDLGLTVIPSNVTSMGYSFNGCTALTTAPIIPSSVTNMGGTFASCTFLTTAPAIPSSVNNMYETFIGCTALTIAPAIPSSVTSLSYTFASCTSLTTAPIIPSSVAIMANTFSGCTSLTTAPAIPNSVTNMYETFRGCTLLHTIQNFAVDVDNCDMTNAFQNCPALANIYVTTLSESSWHLLHTDTGASGTDYTIYNPDGTVAGSGTVAGTSQVLSLYGKSDELVISANITPTLAEETATSQVQWHKSGLPYDDELLIFNAKNPDTVISNFITVNRAGEEFLGNSATATLATQAEAIKPLGNSITLQATPASVTKIIKIATVNYAWIGTIKIRATGNGTMANASIHFGQRGDIGGVQVTYDKELTPYSINKIIITKDAAGGGATRTIYIEFANYPKYQHIINLGVVETISGTFNPSMTEVASVEGTVIDSLSLSYRRGDISSYQHVFTKDIIGNATTASNGFTNIRRSANFTLPTYSDGTHVSVANTHATNTITCTLPTGQTMNGQASFTIIAGKILELELIGSVWIDTNTDYYSTTEQVIGKWIDGKPLYRKIVDLGYLPNDASKNVSHGVTNVSSWINISGRCDLFNIPGEDVKMYMNGTNITVYSSSDRSSLTAHSILEYTKTTD